MHDNSNYDVSDRVSTHVNSHYSFSFFENIHHVRGHEPDSRREPRIWTDSNIRASCGDLRGHHGSQNNDMLINENQVSMHYESSNCDSNRANISNSFEDVSNFIMFTKNTRLSDENRIAEVFDRVD